LDFSSTAAWPRTAPMPWARAATRCGAFPSLFLAPRTVLPSIANDQPAAGPYRPGPQPGSGEPVEHIGADQGERAPVGGFLRCAAVRPQHVRAGIGGPLPDRRERRRPRDHRRDPHGEQPPSARDAGRASSVGPGPGQADQEDAGSGQPPWAKMSSAGGVLTAGDGERRELPSFRPGPSATRGHAGQITRRSDTAGHTLSS